MASITAGRRATFTFLWFVNLVVGFYICLFKGVDLAWFIELSKWSTYGLGVLIGSVAVTDSIMTYKGISSEKPK